MILPNKRRGFRQIIVDFIGYRWKVTDVGNVDIRADIKPRNQLIINIDWEDPWLQDRANMHHHHQLPCNAPISPKFVAMAIEESIKLGWQPDSNITKFNVYYQTGKFTLQS